MRRNFHSVISSSPVVLTEGSVIERLRREYKYDLNPHLQNADCIYDLSGRKILEEIYLQYISAGRSKNIPLLLFTPTWRANPHRLGKAGRALDDVNGDNFRFLDLLRGAQGDYSEKILIGGLIGSRGDAYRPQEAPGAAEALEFHSTQIRALAAAGVDFLFAATLPAFTEALGIARAMASGSLPYIISFVVYAEGTLLDGTRLEEAVSMIDRSVSPAPYGYFINCVHPSVFEKAMINSRVLASGLRGRIIGLQANTSARRPEELDGSLELLTEEPSKFAGSMISLNEKYGIKMLGGCCGTDDRHISQIASLIGAR